MANSDWKSARGLICHTLTLGSPSLAVAWYFASGRKANAESASDRSTENTQSFIKQLTLSYRDHQIGEAPDLDRRRTHDIIGSEGLRWWALGDRASTASTKTYGGQNGV